MKRTKREGFTLVELLIVIVVIGVLSAMMMLSSTEAVSSAKASDIVSDLRNLKTAALAWYADNLDYVSGKTVNVNNKTFTKKLEDERTNILKYMNNGSTVDTKYDFGGTDAEGTWYVWFEVTDSKVIDKLKSRRSSIGLKGNASAHATTGTDYNGEKYVGLFIR
ncbi:MAG: prepilin-type N-terminal cleavage/methylation domain-containing protein [Synergistaceae bacterium]|nr:prepilin-type N-terminal cleavage/methylation domain-containing protein [Synergistaceae bacterium]